MRLGQFRASQGHLSCVLAVVIVVVLLIPATAAAQAQQAAAEGFFVRAEPQPIQERRLRGPSSRTENPRTQGSVGQAAQ